MRHACKLSLLILAALLTTSCQTLEKTLKTTNQAIRVAKSGTAQTLTTIATSDNTSVAVKSVLQARGDAYKTNPTLLISDITNIKRDFARLMSLLQGNVDDNWGRKERRIPDRKHYVKYTQNYKSRAIVDFDKGIITVETLDEKNPDSSLKNAIVTTLLTPDDPRAVDLFSDNEIVLSSDQEPYLQDLVLNHKQQTIHSPKRADAYAHYLISNHKQARKVKVNKQTKQANYVSFNMVNNFRHKQAEKYRPLVERYAKHYDISPSLIYAVIRTESNFNPFAVSHIPAYGLMQLVPASGGRDAYRHARGKDGVPSKNYLFRPDNNIELGVAYLDVLNDNYLKNVQNKISREYCVISAYNTGAGNVLRAFSKDRTQAINMINSMQPPELYKHLRASLPYEEARRYLLKVVNHRREFVSL